MAEYLGVHPNTVRNLVRRGSLPSVQVESLIRFRREDVEAYIERQTRTAEADR